MWVRLLFWIRSSKNTDLRVTLHFDWGMIAPSLSCTCGTDIFDWKDKKKLERKIISCYEWLMCNSIENNVCYISCVCHPTYVCLTLTHLNVVLKCRFMNCAQEKHLSMRLAIKLHMETILFSLSGYKCVPLSSSVDWALCEEQGCSPYNLNSDWQHKWNMGNHHRKAPNIHRNQLYLLKNISALIYLRQASK